MSGWRRWASRRGVRSTGQTVRRWIAWMHGEGYAPASIARKLSTLRSLFRYPGARERGRDEPMLLVPAPKGRKTLPSVLTVEEIERLLAAPDATTPLGIRDRCLFEVLYATGLRVSELLGLQLDQIDWTRSDRFRSWARGRRSASS